MLRVGDVLQVRSERDGPARAYPGGLRVLRVDGPCTCPSYTDRLAAMQGGRLRTPPPGPPHWHVLACQATIPLGCQGEKDLTSHTISARADGRLFYTWAVWDETARSEYVIAGVMPGAQLSLL
jgi:hypothetical protein